MIKHHTLIYMSANSLCWCSHFSLSVSGLVDVSVTAGVLFPARLQDPKASMLGQHARLTGCGSFAYVTIQMLHLNEV